MSRLSLILITAFVAVVSAQINGALRADILQEINSINQAQTSWKAGVNAVTNLPLRDVVRLLGTIIPTNANFRRRKDIKAAANIPNTFDARQQWSQCESISSIKDQGNCGSCWAVAAANCASDRLCIANQESKTNLSTQHLLSSCSNCAPQGGCNGGYPDKAWDYVRDSGIVTGGDYNSEEGCQPYEIPPTGPAAKTPPPRTSCTNSKYKTAYSSDIHKSESSYVLPRDVSKIQTELMTNGPIEAAFTVYNDFLSYKSGVYQRRSRRALGGHAVRLLGWGVLNNVPYWIAANSWNTTWGDNGTFKIRRGTNECGFEQYMTAGLIKK